MNPFLVLLIIIAAVLLWFLLTFLFRPLGKIINNIWSDTKETINKDDE